MSLLRLPSLTNRLLVGFTAVLFLGCLSPAEGDEVFADFSSESKSGHAIDLSQMPTFGVECGYSTCLVQFRISGELPDGAQVFVGYADPIRVVKDEVRADGRPADEDNKGAEFRQDMDGIWLAEAEISEGWFHAFIHAPGLESSTSAEIELVFRAKFEPAIEMPLAFEDSGALYAVTDDVNFYDFHDVWQFEVLSEEGRIPEFGVSLRSRNGFRVWSTVQYECIPSGRFDTFQPEVHYYRSLQEYTSLLETTPDCAHDDTAVRIETEVTGDGGYRLAGYLP